ncbi:MAG: hypothetical protein CL943_01720 [Candidatus Diapherotrites archaeon]|uniref:Nudix hydrolase domain-containing protein n=1 Tax=Candidatus Iainarchaeum sp. TaxID=3101447 RepID=A0A2D6M0S2_9ARCH|nr:hypothetical protein [Candidatus Diapherotrites archaeon]
MQIFTASDHGGLKLKQFLNKELSGKHKIEDLGCESEESCDYPDFAEKLARKVAENKESIGILCCGTGIGMSIAANKISGVRAAVLWNNESAKMAREHNNANIICLGGCLLEEKQALDAVETFLKSEFKGTGKDGERHKRRVGKLDELQPFPEVVVGALILNEKNEVFLMKSPKWGGLYIVPGGHIEVGENRLEALRREVKEETNMDIYDEKLFTLHDAIFPKNFHKKKHFVMIDYLAKPKSTEFKVDGREGTEGIWIQPRLALKELKMDEYTKKALEDYVKIIDLAKVF